LRLAHVWALHDTPWFEHLVVDPGYYDLWAQRIAAGDWLGGDRAFYMDPLYPYLLGALYRLLGRDLLAVRLLQVAMSVGSCALVARLGTMLGGRLLGLGAALWFALYKPEIMFAAEIEKTTLSVLLTAAGLVLFLERSRASRFGAGIVLGLGALTRANLLLFAPLGALVLWRLSAPSGRRASLVAPALFLAGFGLAIAPVAWRNHRVSGAWVPTTTQGGQNFYIGNNSDNLSGSYGALPFVRMNPAFEEEDFHAEAERRTGRALDARGTSRFWYGEALRFMREQPGAALGLLGRKLALMWNDYEISDNQDQYLLARHSWVMRLPLPGFGITAAFAAVGVLATVATMPAVRLLIGFVVLYSASVAAFFVFSRYRIQLVPALVPLAVLGARTLAAHVRERASRRLLADGTVLAGTAAFAFHTIQPFDHGNVQLDAMRLHKLADVHLLAGDADGAIAVLGEAVTRCPERCPGELRARVALYERTGRTDEAIVWLEQLVGTHPGSRAAAAELDRLRLLREDREP
jgi:4-amino-4-deoxy-L-arabinose transferase-like glycosyltransferase